MKRCSALPVAFVCVLTPAIGGGQTPPAPLHRSLSYTIVMGDKPVGVSDVVIESERDGHVTLRSRTRVDIKWLLFSYRYVSTTRETWFGGRLVSAEAETVEDGKTSRTKVTRAEDAVAVVTDKGEHRLAGNVATTSFWNLPHLPSSVLTFLDVETGANFQARATFVKEAEIAVNGAAVPCRLWQLSGDATTRLWFDRNDVLVRMEYEEEGQRFVHVLSRPATTPKDKPASADREQESEVSRVFGAVALPTLGRDNGPVTHGPVVFHPRKVHAHEAIALSRDRRGAESVREGLGYLFRRRASRPAGVSRGPHA